MSKMDWKTVIVGSMMGVIMGGCAMNKTGGTAAAEGDARAFHGNIVSWRPATSVMLISKDEHVGKDQFPNIINVKYDAQTQFYLDDKPATLDQLQQYMNVAVAGHMRDGQLVADTARFSSVLPQNVRRADSR